MSLNRILRHIRRSWRMLAICIAAGLALAGAAAVIQAPVYEAKAIVLVSPNGPLGNAGTALGADAYFIQQRAQSYIDLASSPQVLQPAAANAGLDTLTEESVTVDWLSSSPANLAITVRQPSAREAAAAANAIAQQLATVVDTIERPEGGGNPTVRVSVFRMDEKPSSPVSPDPVLYLLLGLVAGLAVGLPLVLARLLFDRSVSDGAALSEATGEPPLGVIGTTDDDIGLIVRDAPSSTPAAAFRRLRTRIQFATPDAPARSVVVTAAHPGAGTTTVAVNLALATVEAGRRVVLIDANLRDPVVSRLLGHADQPGLSDVLSEGVEWAAVLRPGGAPGLQVLAAGQARGEVGSMLAGGHMVSLLENLEAQADLVIIDAPGVLEYSEAAELAAVSDAVVLVARSSTTRVDDLQKARSSLVQVGATVLGVVVNGAAGP